MKKIKLFAIQTIDGFVSRIDGDIEWRQAFTNPDGFGFGHIAETVDSVVLNRTHYERLNNFDGLKLAEGLAWHVVTRYPFSYTDGHDIHFVLTDAPQRYSFEQQIRELQQTGGRDIWLMGDHELVAQFLQAGLIDEATIVILPVTIGSGIPLAGGSAATTDWELTETTAYASGAVKLCYRRRGAKT